MDGRIWDQRRGHSHSHSMGVVLGGCLGLDQRGRHCFGGDKNGEGTAVEGTRMGTDKSLPSISGAHEQPPAEATLPTQKQPRKQ